MVCSGISAGENTAFSYGECCYAYACYYFFSIIKILYQLKKSFIIRFFKESKIVIATRNSQCIIVINVDFGYKFVDFDLCAPEST